MRTAGQRGRLGNPPPRSSLRCCPSLPSWARAPSSPGSGSVVATELVAEPPRQGNGGPGRCPSSAAPSPGSSQTAAGPKPPSLEPLRDVTAELSPPASHPLFQILPGFLTRWELRISK